MGASWMFLLFEDWLALFHDNVQAFNLSRSADAVDDNTRNSLFEKIRYVHAHLPGWMLRGAYDVKHFFGFPATESEIAGEASTGRSGSGGRASVVFVDEFPEIKEAQKVRQNTASIADTRFFNGTHLGVGTEFHDMVQTPELVHLQFHWTRHPDKNRRLYSWDKERNRPKFWRYVEATDEIVERRTPRRSTRPTSSSTRPASPAAARTRRSGRPGTTGSASTSGTTAGCAWSWTSTPPARPASSTRPTSSTG
jgi:hypothetical protein